MMIAEEERKEKIKKIIVIVLIVGVLLFLVNHFFLSGNKESTLHKVYKNRSYVYEIENKKIGTSTVYSALPYLNLEGVVAEAFNKKVKELYEEADADKNEQFSYQYAVSDNYVSIALVTNKLVANTSYPKTEIETHTFDIENRSEVSEEELLEIFGHTDTEFGDHFKKTMESYYQEEIEKGYLDKKECNYTCFLNIRGVYNYYDDIHLFVQKNKLLYYRPFIIYNAYEDEEMYELKEEDFLFSLQ